MPPFVPRKRHRSPTPEPSPPQKVKVDRKPAEKRAKPTVFDAVDATANSRNKSVVKKKPIVELSDSDDDDDSLSEFDSDEFEDVPPPKRQKLSEDVAEDHESDDAMDWELGTHGIRISFTERGRRYGSTYLPDVAPEQGWNKEEAIVSLLRKAGWVGKKDKWHELDLKVVRYQGKKEHLRYPEFKQFRDWYSEHHKA